jgi:hypothetical protein
MVNISKNEEEKYKLTTLELIEELIIEIQKYSKILVDIFPERLNRYSDIMLSKIWRGKTKKDAYIEGIKSKIIRGGFIFPFSSLSLLASNLETILGASAYRCLHLIKKYENDKITELRLIDGLKRELGIASGEIPIIDEELSLI